MAGVKKSTRKQAAVRIDSSAQIQKATNDPPGTKYRCTCCGTFYPKQERNFQVTYSPLFEGNNGYLSICRTCVDKYYQQLVGFYSGNERHALEHCCRLFDWYYTDVVVDMLDTVPPGKSRIIMYPTKMGMTNVKSKGTTYLDTVRKRQTDRITCETDMLHPSEGGEGKETTVPRETILFFGFGYSDEEYQYLESEYKSWTTRHECQTKAQEELFKGLCIAQLMMRRAQQGGTTKEYMDATKAFQDLLASANLKPSQTNDNSLVEQNTFGTLIRKIENERPICEPMPEWRDVDGIERYISTYFLGHMAKLVHVKNDCADMYEAEMAKHTVSPPQYEGDDDMGATSLLDKYSDKGDKSDD